MFESSFQPKENVDSKLAHGKLFNIVINILFIHLFIFRKAPVKSTYLVCTQTDRQTCTQAPHAHESKP